jgi:hypothetical protein
MERATPNYVYLTLKILCVTFLMLGASITCLLLYVLIMGESFSFHGAVETLVSSGLFFNIAYLYVIHRAKRAEQLAAFLLSVPIAVFVHFVTVVFMAHAGHIWIYEMVNVGFSYFTARGVLKLGDLYYRVRAAS